ncbi:MAG: PQQ-binding-like beta-propeller repeat protein, partial [Chthoniobacter sp.]|uniref:PQQ-binding-like beta-propeller repeat protein n=1 Tax=Chthoniobacter sp. TaxID=2510640 RepID=UPI0032A5F0D5
MNSPRIITALALLSLSAWADDWPQWRGPQRDGVWREKGIMESFPPTGLKVLWRAEAGGSWPSPVVADGRVFLHDAQLTHPRAHERVRCFDATSGKVLWTHAYEVDYPDWAYNAEQNGGPAATPAVVEGKVYALGANGDAMCLHAATGELLWRRDLAKDYAAAELQCRASPLVDGDRVILAIGGKPGACVVALDRNTGRDVWKALDEPAANSSPIMITAGGQRQLIVWTGESISSLNPATGATWWREGLKTSNNDDNATPVCSGDRLLVSGLMFKLDADKPAASILWPENRGVTKRILSNTSTPVIAGDAIYSVTSRGEFVCLDAHTGKQIWATDKVTARKTGPSAHITPHGDTAFLYTDEGMLIHARLKPTGYGEISRTKLIEPLKKQLETAQKL